MDDPIGVVVWETREGSSSIGCRGRRWPVRYRLGIDVTKHLPRRSHLPIPGVARV